MANLTIKDILLWNTSLPGLEWFYQQTTMYSPTETVVLTAVYVPVFVVALVGNLSALAVLLKTVWNRNVLKAAFLINLVIADLAGTVNDLLKVFSSLYVLCKLCYFIWN